MKIIRKTISILIIGIIFFSCSYSDKNKVSIVNLDNLKINEDWVDIPLTIISEKNTDDYYVYLAKGIYKNDTLGITIKLKNGIPPGFVNGNKIFF